ncbi:carboxypeptidase regulatory-like domain-containing protein [Flavobacterium sp. JP2137]|uniref:TonB-dependent receptor n=1 Tax=Flavobacterium sp. JP2137 TaxID=3414510 RepID=UPI003D2FAC98
MIRTNRNRPLCAKSAAALKLALLLCALCASGTIPAQNLSGTITNSQGEPLENSHILARATTENHPIKFVVADRYGRYKVVLQPKTNYSITVNHIGFEAQIFAYKGDDPVLTHDFVLLPKERLLEEITIHFDFQPIVLKRDTITYDVRAFADGTERKLKDQLSKLPGIEVTDDGQVQVNGKTVTHFSVEGNVFFGGGTKLGVENIPADAVAQVELIDHFTAVAQLREVSGSEQLAMNIKLRENKKNFAFGNAKGSFGLDRFYEAHTALFYYASKRHWSTIANSNNAGLQVLDMADILRFESPRRLYLRNTPQQQLVDLHAHRLPNTTAMENKNHLISTDFRFDLHPKWEVKGWLLYHKNGLSTQVDQALSQLQSTAITTESRSTYAHSQQQLSSGKLSAQYRQKSQTTLDYNLQFALTSDSKKTAIFSQADTEAKHLQATTTADQFALSQLFEFHHNFHKKHLATLVVSHVYTEEVPKQNWFSNRPYLDSHIPWTPADAYELKERKKRLQNAIHLSAKYYWIAAPKHHVYTSIGHQTNPTKLYIDDEYLNGETWTGYKDFGNRLHHRLNQSFIGIEHKFLHRKFTATVGLFMQHYQLENRYSTTAHTLSKKALEPEVKLAYQFHDSESLILDYGLKNTYAKAENYADQWRINAFNSLSKGQAQLHPQQQQQADLRYRKFNPYTGFSLFAWARFKRIDKPIRNRVQLLRSEQYVEAINSNIPENQWSLAAFGKAPLRGSIEMSLSASLDFSRYTQVINDHEIPTRSESQQIGLGVKTLLKKMPTLEIRYNKSFHQRIAKFDKKTQGDLWTLKLQSRFLKNGLFKADYRCQKTAIESDKTRVDTLDIRLELNGKPSPWTIGLQGNNLLNSGAINRVRISDFTVDQSTTAVLPRILLLSIQYHL